ncbi:MAG: hypothetical protein Q9O62_04745 [Ardenticatenia bacterium]|nr:hypothetical protein [Ardenticatenia bacterium]
MEMRLGVNYWPARKGVEWWRRFDRNEVADDFTAIAEAGFQAVRLFLLWEDFQPERDRVDPAMVARLERVLDVAADTALRVVPSLFTGTVGSNVVFWPPVGPRRPRCARRPAPLRRPTPPTAVHSRHLA